MIEQPSSTIAAFFSTLWGRILAILAVISLLMGIALEAQSLVTGYYAMKKTAAEADIAEANAKAATGTFKGLGPLRK